VGQRHHHYEAAFESWLREARLPYVMVDEKRRALAWDGSLKSLDFIVSPPNGMRLLIDVKGRQFPGSDRSATAKWNNWTPATDLEHLSHWEDLFGPEFCGLFVFAYDIMRFTGFGVPTTVGTRGLVRSVGKPLISLRTTFARFDFDSTSS